MKGNWAIVIMVAILLGSMYFALDWDRYLFSGVLILGLLIIALIFYTKNMLKKTSEKDTLPDTKYTYDPNK